MNWMYNFSMKIAELLMPLVALFSSKIRVFWSGRKGVIDAVGDFRKRNPGALIWFHVASLGEYEQAKPLIKALKERNSTHKIAVSFFSPSGFEPAKNKPQKEVDFICYLPLDTPRNASDFVANLKPSYVFFVKYDLWNNFLSELKNKKIPIFLISAAFRQDQLYFRQKGFFRNQIFFFDHIFTQNQESQKLLDGIGFHTHTLAGDTRFDRVWETAQSAQEFPEIYAWTGGKPTFVLGSVWQEDMEILIPLINQNNNYKWIIAPHSMDPKPMEMWQSKLKKPSVYYSNWDTNLPSDILFIDNVGMLSSLYQFARIAYVGGGFGKGLHNILEPLGFGVPVLFGKVHNDRKFPEAKTSHEIGCGFKVKNFEELIGIVESLEDQGNYELAVKAAQTWLAENVGATDRILNVLTRWMGKA
ncbi:3-deoxy-D-manno-octulosonic acid transferase [Algoriphagus hitonicola]|uniref:3-deoxy-D-manno-octulosonic acid transferase n=1 Tax=Algoriphagus hitonicola TaxID=435880 RepID=A0A1I2UVX4_9BACT|nr:glycosyltransferase N-terminal domain-containing protein [Algoriphagus hitonicola]SFG81170.1 3-deoxy-D-manno-octulosonic-acid transferase [Algoriphagus hitonicola]